MDVHERRISAFLMFSLVTPSFPFCTPRSRATVFREGPHVQAYSHTRIRSILQIPGLGKPVQACPFDVWHLIRIRGLKEVLFELYSFQEAPATPLLAFLIQVFPLLVQQTPQVRNHIYQAGVEVDPLIEDKALTLCIQIHLKHSGQRWRTGLALAYSRRGLLAYLACDM